MTTGLRIYVYVQYNCQGFKSKKTKASERAVYLRSEHIMVGFVGFGILFFFTPFTSCRQMHIQMGSMSYQMYIRTVYSVQTVCHSHIYSACESSSFALRMKAQNFRVHGMAWHGIASTWHWVGFRGPVTCKRKRPFFVPS